MMVDGIPFPLVEFSPWAILGFTIVLLLTGRLRPKSALDEVRKDLEYWRELAMNSAEVVRTQAGTISKFKESTELQKLVMTTLQEQAQQVGGEVER